MTYEILWQVVDMYTLLAGMLCNFCSWIDLKFDKRISYYNFKSIDDQSYTWQTFSKVDNSYF